jgi:DNA polymerase-4
VKDLNLLGELSLVSALGKASGKHLYALSCGDDDRPVEVDRAMKSIGHEETFARDLHELGELRTELVRLSDGVASRLRSAGVGARTLTLKVRFAGFTTITRSTTLVSPVATAAAIVEAVAPLLAAVDPTPGVRLLGVHASNFGAPVEQLRLDELFVTSSAPAPADWVEASLAIDAIRTRFGDLAIGPASAVTNRGLRLVRRGAQQWGPDHDSAPDEKRVPP